MSVRDGVKAQLSFLVLTSALVVSAGRAAAQTRPPDPLALPAGSVMCRSLPVTPADSVGVLLDVSEESDSLYGRESLFAFDSAGNPIYMVVSGSDSRMGEQLQARTTAVRFTPHMEGYHRVFVADSTGRVRIVPDSSTVPQVDQHGSGAVSGHGTPLRDDEFIAARQLARWFWDHRCGKSRHAPGDSTTLTKP